MSTRHTLTCDQLRRLDQISIEEFGIPGIVLMENAGRGAAERIQSITPAGDVLILCGKGNNGGDGYVIARHLVGWGRNVTVVSTCDLNDLSGDAATNAEIARRIGVPIEVVRDDRLPSSLADHTENRSTENWSVVVDGLVGSGAQPPLRGVYAEIVRWANQTQATRFALDVPSGLNADTGERTDPTFCADHTLTFAASKSGFREASAFPVIGSVHVIEIGAPAAAFAKL